MRGAEAKDAGSVHSEAMDATEDSDLAPLSAVRLTQCFVVLGLHNGAHP